MQSPAPRVVLGLALAALVVWLGLQTDKPHPAPIVVVGFGLASALVAPLALNVLGGLEDEAR